MTFTLANIIALLFWLVMPFLISTIMVFAVRKYLIKHKIVDKPNNRTSHNIPTPRGGGLGFVPVLLLFGFLYCYLGNQSELLEILILTGLLCFFTWFDDKKNQPAWSRLAIQAVMVLAALVFIMPASLHILPELLPQWLSYVLLFLGWLWFINLFNFMDGIDGISVIQSVSIALGLILLAFLHVPFMLALIGSMVGFLVWNWPPAKIFMGDTGSVGLGYLIGYFLIHTANYNLEGFYVALILPLYYLMDATITLLKRLINKEKIWEAHRQHFYQMATTNNKRTHRRAIIVLFGCNIGLIACAALAVLYGWVGLLAAFAISSLTLLIFSRGVPFYLKD